MDPSKRPFPVGKRWHAGCFVSRHKQSHKRSDPMRAFSRTLAATFVLSLVGCGVPQVDADPGALVEAPHGAPGKQGAFIGYWVVRRDSERRGWVARRVN